MAGFKNGKIMLPIKEFLIVKGQATYELNTIDMTKVTVFYRKYNQEAFLETYSEMPKGDYRINEVGGNKQLEITNLDILDEYYSIQLARVVDLTSSPYNPSGQIDVITLNQHLNEVIADVTFLFTYLKDVGMVMDSSNGNKIMAELKPYTTWYMDKDGNMAAMPVDSLFEKFNDLVQELRQEVLKLLEQDLEVAERELLEEVKRQLDEYVETDLKQRLDDYTTQLEERLQTMIDQAVADKGLMPEGSDWLEIGLGNWLVVDLFNKNYIHYPPQLNSSDNAGVVKKDITDGGKSQIIRYYTTTGKMLFIVRVNGVCSEWQELGEQTDTMQFTQANHGFIFTAVTLDGATRQWVKANKYTSSDGIAIKIDNDRFDVVTRGVVNIPTSARDDKGEPFVYDEYYFLSQEVDGGFSRTKNEIGTFQYLAHISEIDGKQVAYIDIGDSYDLDYEVVDTETADRVGIGTYKTTLRTADTIEDLKRLNLKEGDVVEVLGYYTKGDGANHKRKIENSDDGSGVLLDNGLYANIVHNGEVNVSWFGISKINSLEENGILLNKAINSTQIKTFKFTENIDIGGIILERQDIMLEGLERNDTIRGGFIVLNCSKEIDFIDCSKVSTVNMRNLRIMNFKNCIHTTNEYFRPSFYNVDMYGGSENGINYVPVINDNYKSFGLASFPKGLVIRDTKIAINIDFRSINYKNYANLESLNECVLVGNEIGIYIRGLGRAEAFCLNSVDLSANNANRYQTNFSELKTSLETKKFGAIIMENCEGVNIRLVNCYLEYCGSVAEISNEDLLSELKNSTIYQNITKEKEGVYYQDDSMQLAFNQNYGTLNIINSSKCGFLIENSWIKFTPAIIKGSLIGNNNNRFVTLGYNDMNCDLEYADKFNNQIINDGIDYISISKETTPNKQNSNYYRYKIKNEYLPYLMNRFEESGLFYSSEKIDLSKYDTIGKFYSKVSRSAGVIELKNTFDGELTSAYPLNNTNNIVFIDGTFNINAKNDKKFFLSSQSNNNITFFRTKFVFIGDMDCTIFNNLQGMNLTFYECDFDFSNYSGSTVNFIGISVLNIVGCGTTGNVPTFNYSSSLILNTNIQKPPAQLNTPYHINLMEQDGGTTKQDFYTYLDEKFTYDKQVEAEEQTKYEAYQQALKNNPNLTYEEFIISYPSVIPIIEEPTIPQSVQEFMKKYL